MSHLRTEVPGATLSFWDALAPYHAKLEDSYLDLSSLKRLLPSPEAPVLLVGAGHGLIVGALREKGFKCDGVDLSTEMIRHAQTRRGIDVMHADARAIPVAPNAYRTIVYATGVIDFMSDEAAIRAILEEGRRIAGPSGRIFVAFYKMSRPTEDLMLRTGLVRNNVFRFKESLEVSRLKPPQAIAWIAKRANINRLHALFLAMRSSALSSWQEKRNALHMQRLRRISGYRPPTFKACRALSRLRTPNTRHFLTDNRLCRPAVRGRYSTARYVPITTVQSGSLWIETDGPEPIFGTFVHRQHPLFVRDDQAGLVQIVEERLELLRRHQ